MKNNIFIISLLATLLFISCKKSEFEEYYADPSKIAESTVERQYTGVIVAAQSYIVPDYRNYFVTLRSTLNPWNNAISVINGSNMYIPGSSGTEDVWFNYYYTMAQYRDFQKIYANSSAEDQENRKIFEITARVFMAYYTQRMVDLFGNIPYFNAGRLSENGGDYAASFASFDRGEDIYVSLLDDLKKAADELNSISLTPGYQASFTTQDIINNGNIELWKRLTNSLRIRMLTRVSGASSFSSRANSEMQEIISNSGKYPLIEQNDQNAMIDIFDVNSPINSKGFQNGINSDGWDGNDANKNMIDILSESNDPRLRVLFEKTTADSLYRGLDPLLPSGDQSELISNGMISQYNRSTMSNNQFFPGVLMSAAEVQFLLAEYYHKKGNDIAAKQAYEMGIQQSIEFYYYVRSISGDNVAGDTEPWTAIELAGTLLSAPVNWDLSSDKLKLIATQKWLHCNIIQPYENWAELRRSGGLGFQYWVDQNSQQPQPPVRWTIPTNEVTFNTENYNAIKSEDDLNNKLFWDVN